MLLAIAPSYANIPNTLPENGGIDSKGMVSYFLFWIIQLPLLLIPPTKLRYLFMVKLIAAPIAALAIMGWCVHRAGGSGEIFQLQATLTGSEKAWKFLSAMSSVTGWLDPIYLLIPEIKLVMLINFFI
jgi:NCS1 family nucleobase:cation symporter-1